MPDLARIRPPVIADRCLVFYAENRALDMPYEVTVDLDRLEKSLTYVLLPDGG